MAQTCNLHVIFNLISAISPSLLLSLSFLSEPSSYGRNQLQIFVTHFLVARVLRLHSEQVIHRIYVVNIVIMNSISSYMHDKRERCHVHCNANATTQQHRTERKSYSLLCLLCMPLPVSIACKIEQEWMKKQIAA